MTASPHDHEDLAWQAYRYTTGELSSAEQHSFEELLADDETACAELVKAVQLQELVRAACSQESGHATRHARVAATRPAATFEQPRAVARIQHPRKLFTHIGLWTTASLLILLVWSVAVPSAQPPGAVALRPETELPGDQQPIAVAVAAESVGDIELADSLVGLWNDAETVFSGDQLSSASEIGDSEPGDLPTEADSHDGSIGKFDWMLAGVSAQQRDRNGDLHDEDSDELWEN